MTDVPWIRLEQVRLVENVAPDGRTPKRRTVIEGATLHVPPGRYMLVGLEADRRCVIDLITGRRDPASGRLLLGGTCSYPIGRVSPFSIPVTGFDMLHFLAEVYDFDVKEASDRLEAILPWPTVLHTRLDRASPAQRAALSVATAEFINVDIFLVDGSILHPEFPETFLGHIAKVLPNVLAGRLAIISSRQSRLLQPLVTRSLIVNGGRIWIADEVVQLTDVTAAMGDEEETP